MRFDRVLKFGGAALADGPGVQRACEIVRRSGERAVVVVSAHHGVTSLLETVARSAAEGLLEGDRVRIRHRSLLRQLALDSELLDRYFTELFGLLSEIKSRGKLFERERDLVLSFGERMSARIVAQTLRGAGLQGTPVDAFDLGLTSDSNHGNAQPLSDCSIEVRRALEEIPGIPVVTGFLAKDKHGNLTTLGRNGSDLTAALIAEAIGASELQLWKAVGGMMTADPSLVPDARVIERLSFQDAAEFAFHGAEVVHAAALAPVKRADIPVRVLDVNDPNAPGTVLEAGAPHDGPVGIAAKKRVVRIDLSLDACDARGQRLADLFQSLARRRVEPMAIASAAERASVIVAPCDGLDAVLAELGRAASVERDLALLAVIGGTRGIAKDPMHAPGAERAPSGIDVLRAAGVEIIETFFATRMQSQAFIVQAADLERAARALHAGLLRKRVTRPTPAAPLPSVPTADGARH
jgi:aspartate kinase